MIWLILYNLASPFLLAAFMILGFLTPRGRRGLKDLAGTGLSERLGFGPVLPNVEIWLHAASLGEARLWALLLERIKDTRPGVAILATTQTRAGLEYIRRNYEAKGLVSEVGLAPLDLWPCVRLYMRRLPNARVLLIAETELWPNLLSLARSRGLAVGLVNGRMSPATRGWIAHFPGLGRRLFKLFSAICVSENSYERWLREIYFEAPVTVTGNLKWDTSAAGAPDAARCALYRTRWGVLDSDFLWVAASTREGEEKTVLEAYIELRRESGRVKLVLAPRHLERCAEVLGLARSAGFLSALSSELEWKIKPDAVIIDQFGALTEILDAADGVFMGGSLRPGFGGHNFLEPAALAKPIATGPYLENFKDIALEFWQIKAMACAQDAVDLARIVGSWLKDPGEARNLGSRGRALLESRRGAAQRTWAVIEDLLPRHSRQRTNRPIAAEPPAPRHQA